MYRIVLNETSYYGAGCRSVIAEEVRKRGFRKALLVTDKDLIRFGVAEKIERVLADAGIPYEIYSEIKANPTIRNVQQGVEAFKRSGADFMVALGGGSSIDTAKAVGIIVNNPEFADVRSLEGTAATKHRAVPTFAVPTTAGTAAEVTINYVITDEEAKRKMVCVDPNDIPMCAVIDCELMYSMPKGLTAATGMDALTHAVEGYLTPGAWTMSDMFELKAIELIARHLKNAVDDGSDETARAGMAEAQYIAGMGFSNVGLGIVHSMAHPLGAFYDTPHGVANATLLPYVMEYNAESACKIPRYRPRHGREDRRHERRRGGARCRRRGESPLAEHPHPAASARAGRARGGYSGAGGGCVQRCLHGRQSPSDVRRGDRTVVPYRLLTWKF